jgi:hypothetical protein
MKNSFVKDTKQIDSREILFMLDWTKRFIVLFSVLGIIGCTTVKSSYRIESDQLILNFHADQDVAYELRKKGNEKGLLLASLGPRLQGDRLC